MNAQSHVLLHPKNWKPAKGYANGIAADGRLVFVAGQIGWNAAQQFESGDFIAQTRQALQNVVAIVREAGGSIEHITRLTWYITDKKEYLARLAEIGEAYRSVMGKHFPAMTMVQVSALMEDAAKSNRFKGIIGINKAPTVSCDFNHDPHSSTFDVTQTQVVDKRFVRVLSWYDNEWGFSNRMVEVAGQVGGLG